MKEFIKYTHFNIIQSIVNLAGNINKEAFTFSDINHDLSVYVNYRASVGPRIKLLQGAINSILGREPSDMHEFMGIIFACQEAVEAKKHLASLRAEAITPPILSSYKTLQPVMLPRRLDFDSLERQSQESAPSRKRKSVPIPA